MLKKLIFGLLHPALYLYAMLRFKDIWGLKAHLQKHPSRLLRLVYGHYFLRRGSYIGLSSEIAGTPCFPHGAMGVFVSDSAKLGRDVVIFQQVTIGSNGLSDSRQMGAPTIGDRVYIGAGAKIVGEVTIGDNCRIGANAVVYTDMPPHSVAVCAPTRILQKENLDNTYRYTFDGVRYAFTDGKLRPEKEPPKTPNFKV